MGDVPPPPHAQWAPPPPPPGTPPPPPPGSGPPGSGGGNTPLIAAVVIVVLAVGGFLGWRLLGGSGDSPDLALSPSPSAAAALATPTAAPTGGPVPAAPTDGEATSQASDLAATAQPAPADTEESSKEDRVTALFSSLDDLAVDEVAGFQLREREPSTYIEELGGEGEFLSYRRNGRLATQINGLFADSAVAQEALEQRYQLLVEESGHEVEFDEPLRDAEDIVIGRVLSVITGEGDRIVSWTNSNVLVTIGPDRPRLMERWYEALPY